MDQHSPDSIQILLAVCWPWVQQYLKNARWAPWITKDTSAVNRLMSLFVAAAATAGFHMTGNAQQGWTLAIPPLAALAHIVAQWTAQHIVYSTTIEHPAMLKQLQASVDALKQGAVPPPAKS